MLIRAVPAAMAVATSVVIRPPPLWISELAVYVAYSVSPCIRLVAVIAAVTLFVTAGWQRWRPAGVTAEPAVPVQASRSG